MKKIKNPIYIALVIQIILFQIIGIIALNKYNNPELNHLIVYMDIAIFLSLLRLFITKVLDKNHKILNFIFIPSIFYFIIYSIWPLFILRNL